jgi:hypothetical protein
MELTDGAHLTVTAGRSVIAGLRKLEEETAYGIYAKAAQAGMGRARVHGLWEKGGTGGAGRAERPDQPAGRWADWAKSKEK